MPRHAISIVIPTRNEAENIDELIERLLKTAASASLDAEILVVDDRSIDGTQDRVRAWEGKASAAPAPPVRLIVQDNDRGLSGAVFQGASAAAHDIVVVMDADLSHPAEAIPALVAPLFDASSDMVIGSRYVRGGRIVGFPWHRSLLSRGATWLSRLLFDGVADPMAGFFAVGRQRIVNAASQAAGFKIGFEILAHGGAQLRVKEIPIEFLERRHGSSKATFKVGLVFLKRLGALAGGNLAWSGVDVAAGMLADILVFCGALHLGLRLIPAHFAGATAAWAVYFLLRGRREKNFGSVSGFAHSAAIFLLALFLRGGILGSLTNIGWPVELSIAAAAAATALLNFIAHSFYVFPDRAAPVSPERRWRMAAVGVFAYIFLLKLAYFSLPNLIPQEAYYWNYSKHLDLGYLDHPPMIAWVIAAGTALGGDTEFGIRIGGLLCALITSGFVYALARNLFGKDCAMRAVLLALVLPFFVSFFMLPDAPLFACWAAALCFLERALIGQSRKAWLGFGVAMGFGMLSKYTICLLGGGTLLFALLDRRARHRATFMGLALATLIALALFSPVIYWNARHHWASFLFQGPRRLQEASEFSLHYLIGDVLLLLTPFGCLGFALAAYSALFRPRIDPINTPTENKGIDPRWLFVLVFTLAPLSIFLVFSVLHRPLPHWTGPIWLAGIPAIAFAMTPQPQIPQSLLARLLQRSWKPAILTLLIVYGCLLHFVSLGLPRVSYAKGYGLPIVWREIGRQIESIAQDVKRKTHLEPLVVGMDRYYLSSELAFYRQKFVDPNDPAQRNQAVANTTSAQLFEREGLMYTYWFPEPPAPDRPIIMVTPRESDLKCASVLAHMKTLEDIKTLIVEKNGREVTRIYYRIGSNYQKEIPRAIKPQQTNERR